MANKFSANASTIGYLYQIRFALFVLLQRIEYNPDAQISGSVSELLVDDRLKGELEQ